MKQISTLLILIYSFTWTFGAESGKSGQIVIENAEFRLILGADAIVRSLVHKSSKQECLAPGVAVPAFSVTQYRPYDNGTIIPVRNRLYLEFNLPREEVIAVMEKARMVPVKQQ